MERGEGRGRGREEGRGVWEGGGVSTKYAYFDFQMIAGRVVGMQR